MFGITSSVLELEPDELIKENERSLMDSRIFQLSSARRAIKYFKNGHNIDDDTINKIVTAATYAPSVFNLQHWSVVRVVNTEVKKNLSLLSWNQPQILGASEILVVVYNKGAWRHPMNLSINYFSEQECGSALHRFSTLYGSNQQLARDEGIRSSAMFSMILMLAAKEFGIDSCPMTGFDFQSVHRLLCLEEEQEVCMLIALGVASKDNRVRERNRIPVSSILRAI